MVRYEKLLFLMGTVSVLLYSEPFNYHFAIRRIVALSGSDGMEALRYLIKHWLISADVFDSASRRGI